jgi:chorismate-pyruvate lyase
MLNLFKKNNIDPANLSTLQRILLSTDGTLTEILEAYFLEQIVLVKLSEHMFAAPADIAELHAYEGDQLIQRRILLQGAQTKQNYVYADSFIVVDRIDERMKQDLLDSKIPLGRLWLQHRMETFKEMMNIDSKPAGELCSYFDIAPEDRIFSRSYRVFSKRTPIIFITEIFPIRE